VPEEGLVPMMVHLPGLSVLLRRWGVLGGRRGAGDRYGLRRQWRNAFVLMFAVLGITVSATAVAYTQVVGHYRAAAGRVERGLSLSSRLTEALTAHEEVAHQMWAGAPVDVGDYLRQQERIVALFGEGLQEVRGDRQHALLATASQTWHQVLVSRALWAPDLRVVPGVTASMQATFGADSDQVVATLGALAKTAISDGASDLRVADRLQAAVIGLLAAMVTLLLGVTLYFARRMNGDVVRPLEQLQRAAASLGDGNLEHRVQVSGRANRNELGRLAQAFNTMAHALDESHRDLSRQAAHDTLTGLPNRATFQRRLEGCFTRAARPHTGATTVLFIDLDDFKIVNDTLGHTAGDTLLVGVAGRLSSCIRPSDLVARLGGDEFAVLLADRAPASDSGLDSAAVVADRIRQALCEPFTIEGHQVRVGASIGSSRLRSDIDNAQRLLAEADFAMYTAKRLGKGRHEVFDTDKHGDDILPRATAPMIDTSGSTVLRWR
jgi:diguanylate cyclase (GGDEF)-like protein